MLKKINLGLVALVLGFGLVFTQSAFTSSKKVTEGRAKLTFHYEGPLPMTKADVEDESNWVYGEETCPEGNTLACAIEIEDTYVDNPSGPTPTLNSSAALVSDPLIAAPRVTGSADNSIVIYNRQQN